MIRSVTLIGVAGLCLAAEPSAEIPHRAEQPAEADATPPAYDRLPSPGEFASLARTDPVALLEAAARRYRAEVRGLRAVLHKQERINGTLYPPEVARVSLRENPYAVRMMWEQGARTVRVGGISFGKVEGVLYAAGENGGNALAWRPGATFAAVSQTSPLGDQARMASRYPLTEAGPGAGVNRTFRAWSMSRTTGRLHVEYLGANPVSELGGRVCHVLRRTCDPPEVDPFAAGEPAPDPTRHAADAFRTVTVMIDSETGLQLGSELRRVDGELLGAYFFREVELNPRFGPDEFTPAAFQR